MTERRRKRQKMAARFGARPQIPIAIFSTGGVYETWMPDGTITREYVVEAMARGMGVSVDAAQRAIELALSR